MIFNKTAEMREVKRFPTSLPFFELCNIVYID